MNQEVKKEHMEESIKKSILEEINKGIQFVDKDKMCNMTWDDTCYSDMFICNLNLYKTEIGVLNTGSFKNSRPILFRFDYHRNTKTIQSPRFVINTTRGMSIYSFKKKEFTLNEFKNNIYIALTNFFKEYNVYSNQQEERIYD